MEQSKEAPKAPEQSKETKKFDYLCKNGKKAIKSITLFVKQLGKVYYEKGQPLADAHLEVMKRQKVNVNQYFK